MNSIQASTMAITNLRRYLISRGWKNIEHPNKRIDVMTSPEEHGDHSQLSIPRSSELRDSSELINEAINLIAAYEQSPVEKIVDHVLRWDRDIIRTRFIKVLGHEDSLPLGIAANAVSSLKEFLGYAAHTHTNPRPFFDRAGAYSAIFANHCLFGHTFKGSFGLTIECPLEVPPEFKMDEIEPTVPIERQIVERIANGLVTLRESIASDSIDPMLAGYLTGFSANMCRKLAEIYEDADGRRVEYDISWSPQLTSPCEHTWKPMIFDGRAYEFARVAAGALEKAEEFPDSVIKGRIVVLKSETPPGLDEQAEFEHIITMSWEREKGQTVKIRVPLSPQQYIEACDAHKEGRPIQIQGTPEKAGKFWTLTRPHDFEVLVI